MTGFYHNKWIHIFSLIFLYLLVIFFFKKEVVLYKFDQKLIHRYFLSQDITHEVPGIRQFLSDGDIYTATGYLYAQGADPTSYNFQAPPLIKYLFGLSILIFGSPYYVQIIFGAVLIAIVYTLGVKMYKSSLVPLLACIFLIIDPVFLEVSSNALLDLGQAAFLLLYFYLVFFHKKRYALQGIVLGLLCASKFWAGPLFFVLLLAAYNIYKKNFDLKKFTLHLIIAAVIFSLTYIKTFINKGFEFNIVFFQLKILKFLVIHDIRSFPFASLFLFLTGYYQTWWGSKSVSHAQIWSIFWPIGLMLSAKSILDAMIKRFVDLKLFVGIIPMVYILYLGVQAPFTRYFILILPFLYLNLSKNLLKR